MKDLFLLVGSGFVLVFVYGVFYYILGRILMIFKSDKLRRIGHYLLAASGIAGPVTIVKKCPRICNGKCKVWNCPLYRPKDCKYFFLRSEQHIYWDRITSDEDPTDVSFEEEAHKAILRGDYVDGSTDKNPGDNPTWCGGTHDDWRDLYESAKGEDDE